MPGERSAAARWRQLVTARLDEVERLSPRAGSVSGSFWEGGRAERYAAHARSAPEDSDPFVRRLRRVTRASSTTIDVGAGTGRFALALAAGVQRVVAVDPSPAMLAVLQRDAEQRAIGNVARIEAKWEDAEVEQADVAFSSFVLPLVPDAPAFVEKLERTARERVLLYLGAFSSDALIDPLWRHFHDVPRVPGPTYLDALAVVRELGARPAVKVVEIANTRRFGSIAEAAEQYRDWLLLPATDEVREELAALLPAWLAGRSGALRSPWRSVTAAIIEWRPHARG